MKFDNIIFDLDGTLWDSTEPIVVAWNEVLRSFGMKELKVTELYDCMGLTMNEIAAKLFPEENSVRQREIMDALIEHENKYLYEHGARLYADLEETLAELSKSFLLYIVSNCQKGYIEAFLHAHRLEKYFADWECWGNTGASKDKSIRILIERNKLDNCVYVGDTAGDARAAAGAGIPFIHAAYGFGKVEESMRISTIYSIKELKNVLY